MLKAILFDLDGTLVEQEHAAARAAVAWAADHGITDPDVATRWATISDPHYRAYQRREVSFAEQRRARVREFLGRDLSDSEADALFDGYLWRYEAGWTLFEDALPALRRVRGAGLQAIIFTNGNTAHQQSKLDRFALTSEVDGLISSDQLPAGKPDPRSYRQALARSGLEPQQALMVGDSLTNDVRGALDAGLHAVHLDRYDEYPDAGVRRISTLHELSW